MELFDGWKLVMQPTLQTAHEYEGAARDFVDFLGDIPVEDIEQNDLLDYRDEARYLPATMPKVDRALSFTERLDRHRHSDTARVGPITLKKRIGGIQALLSFAKGQKWISRNEGRDVPVVGYESWNGIPADIPGGRASPAVHQQPVHCPPALEARSCRGRHDALLAVSSWTYDRSAPRRDWPGHGRGRQDHGRHHLHRHR